MSTAAGFTEHDGRRVWIDEHGIPWPVTGDWCTECGRPLIRVDHRDTHPTCAPFPDAHVDAAVVIPFTTRRGL